MIVAREHSPFLVACVRREIKARNPSLQEFSCKILRHSHFAIMWLVCSAECKQTTNTTAIFWGGALHDIQKTSAKETKYLIMYLKNALDGEDVILS